MVHLVRSTDRGTGGSDEAWYGDVGGYDPAVCRGSVRCLCLILNDARRYGGSGPLGNKRIMI